MTGTGMSGRTFKIALRAVMSGLLLWWVWPRDLAALGQALREASPGWLLAALALHAVGVWLSAVRWRMLLEATGTRVPVSRLAASYLVGFFFNTWLPSGFGGDAVRAWDTRREADGAARSVAVIAIERGTGILALAFLGAVVSLAAGWQREVPTVVVTLWLATVVGFLGLAALAAFGPALASKLESAVPGLWRWRKAAGAARRLLVTSSALSSDRRLVARVMGVGVLLQLNVVLHYAWIGRALDVPVGSSYFFVVVPVLVAVLMLPISINGIGAREMVFVRFLGAVGVAEPQALAVSLCAFAMVLVFSLVGGLVYVLRGATARA
jgi:uncharacterized protein (TIRG00374 family)